jgi:uncharacterized membrane protein
MLQLNNNRIRAIIFLYHHNKKYIFMFSVFIIFNIYTVMDASQVSGIITIMAIIFTSMMVVVIIRI